MKTTKERDTMKKTVKGAHLAIAAAVLISFVAGSANAADQCVYQTSPQAVTVLGSEREAQIDVIASDPGCSAEVKSDADWIVATPSTLKGSGTIHLKVNPSVDRKVGTVRIGSDKVTVFEKGLWPEVN